MQCELDALKSNGICSLVDLPPKKHYIECKWTFKAKHKSHNVRL